MNTQQNFSDVPQYLVIRNYLLECMAKGELEPGKQLPSERTLSHNFKTTRVTAREALLALETEGKIFRVNRQGWFVSPNRIEYNLGLPLSIVRQAEQQGVQVEISSLKPSEMRTKTQEKESASLINPNSFQQADIPSWEVAIHFDGRLAMVEKRKISERMSALLSPLKELKDEQYLEKQWKECMSQTWNVESFVQPIALADDLCSVFKVSAGAPGMEVRKFYKDKDGQLVAESVEIWRHDAIRFHYGCQFNTTAAAPKMEIVEINRESKREDAVDLVE